MILYMAGGIDHLKFITGGWRLWSMGGIDRAKFQLKFVVSGNDIIQLKFMEEGSVSIKITIYITL